MADRPWSDVQMGSDPRLLVGRRERAQRLSGMRLDVHEDAFGPLAEIGARALDRLDASTARPWEPFAHLEQDEYFETRAPTPITTNAVGEADLVEMVSRVDQLEVLLPAALPDLRLLLYAICWPTPSAGMVGFVRKTDPHRGLSRGRYFQYRTTLRAVDPPDLILEPDIDLVVTSDVVAIFNPTAYKTLLADAEVALENLGANVALVGRRLSRKVPLTAKSRGVLEAAAHRRTSLAARIALLPDRIASIGGLDASTLAALLAEQDIPADLLLDRKGHLDFDEDGVPAFLDVIEGRYFDDPLGDEHRRADRFSTRPRLRDRKA